MQIFIWGMGTVREKLEGRLLTEIFMSYWNHVTVAHTLKQSKCIKIYRKNQSYLRGSHFLRTLRSFFSKKLEVLSSRVWVPIVTYDAGCEVSSPGTGLIGSSVCSQQQPNSWHTVGTH